MNVQSFKTVFKAIFDAEDLRDKRIGYVLSGMTPQADGGGSLEVSIVVGTYVKNSETSFSLGGAAKVSLSAADPANTRVDAIYMSSLGVLTAASGTAVSINPVPPAWPAGAAPLAVAFIPPGAVNFATGGYVGDVTQVGTIAPNVTLGGTPSVGLASVAAAGVGLTYVRTDANIVAFDNVVPASISLGGAAVSGTTSFAARSNHGHEQRFVGFRVFSDVGQAIASGGIATCVTFNSERYDTDGQHSSTASPARVTFPTPGKYHLGANIQFNADAGSSVGFRSLALRLNGSQLIGQFQQVVGQTISVAITLNIGADWDIVSTDFLEVIASHNIATAISLSSISGVGAEVWGHKVG